MCPDDDALGAFVHGTLSEERAARVQDHVDACSACAAIVAEYRRAFSAPAGMDRGPRRVFGRYDVVGVVGRGGMGTVFEAVDRTTGRRVAVKALHREGSAEGSSRQARLLHEAQALARLSHPNVVQVFDVGLEGDEAFMVAELVSGATLDQWLADAERSWREITAVFVEIGRGLAAAHEAGLIHRDVKPQNLIVDKGGVPRVMDFGLARVDVDPGPSTDEDGVRPAGRVSGLPMTKTGALVGTPAYMAPEQLGGRAATPSSDQFSLCVALYEALYGRRPFEGRTIAQLQAAMSQGRPPASTPSRGEPRRLRRAILRGLQPAPDQRWPSMHALVRALDRSLAGRAGWVAAATAAGILAVAGAAWFPSVQTPDCATETTVDNRWTAQERGAIADAFRATGLDTAEERLEQTQRLLDDWASRWRAVHEHACPGQPRPLECLQRQRLEFDATVSALSRGGAMTVARGAEAVAKLPAPQECLDAPPKARHEESPDLVRARERTVATAALVRLGLLQDALVESRAAVAEAARAGSAHFEAGARMQLGYVLSQLGDADASEEELRSAAFVAMAAGDDEQLLHAATTLLVEVAGRNRRLDDTEVWIGYAEAAAERLGDPPLLEAELASARGQLHRIAGRYPEAQTEFEREAQLREQVQGPEHPELVAALANLAVVLNELGEYDRAIELSMRVIDTFERVLGPDHPDLAIAHNNLGSTYSVTGDIARAKEQFSRAYEIRQRVLSPDHPSLASSLANLGICAYQLGEFEEALGYYDQALKLLPASGDTSHAVLLATNSAAILSRLGRHAEARARAERGLLKAQALGEQGAAMTGQATAVLAFALMEAGELEAAAERFIEAIEISKKVNGPDSIDVAESEHLLGKALYRQGKVRPALEQFDRARTGFERALGSDSVQVAIVQTSIGTAHSDLGHHDRALGHLEPALATVQGREAGPDDVAATRFAAARALVAAGRDRQRAIVLARQARDFYTSAGGRAQSQLAETEAWLDKYGR